MNLPTRIATIAETGSGADITMNGLLQVVQFGDKYLDVTGLCKEIAPLSLPAATAAGSSA